MSREPSNVRSSESKGSVLRGLGLRGSAAVGLLASALFLCVGLVLRGQGDGKVELQNTDDPGLRGSGDYVGTGMRWDPGSVVVSKPGLSFNQASRLHSHFEQQRWASRFGPEAAEAQQLRRARSLQAIRRAYVAAHAGPEAQPAEPVDSSSLAWVKEQLARRPQASVEEGNVEVWHPNSPISAASQARQDSWHPAGTSYGVTAPTPQIVRSQLHPAAEEAESRAPVPRWVRDDEETPKRDCGGDCVPRSMVAPFNPLSAYQNMGYQQPQGPPRWVRDDQGSAGIHPSFGGGSQSADAQAFKQLEQGNTPISRGRLPNTVAGNEGEQGSDQSLSSEPTPTRKDDTLHYLLKALNKESGGNKVQLANVEPRANPSKPPVPQAPAFHGPSSGDMIQRAEKMDENQDQAAERDLIALDKSDNGSDSEAEISPMHDALSQVVNSMDAKQKKQMALKRILDRVEKAQVAAEKNNEKFRSLLRKFGDKNLAPSPLSSDSIQDSELRSGDVEAQLALEEKKEIELQKNDKQLADQLDQVIEKARKAVALRDKGEAMAERMLASKYENQFGSDADAIVPEGKGVGGEDTTGSLQGMIHKLVGHWKGS